MRNALPLAVAGLALFCLTTAAEARREPRRSFVAVRYLADARVDDAFHADPLPPTRDEQLRPLPSFAVEPGFHGVHSSIWNRVRNYDWVQQQAQRLVNALASYEPSNGPRTIEVVQRVRSGSPTTQPVAAQGSADQPIIASVTIR